MPKGYYSLDQLAKAAPTVSSDSPLDDTDPKIEPEDPRDDYHREWGFFAFLYESPDTLAAGGLTSLVPISIGGLTLSPPDVWQVPNLDLVGGDPVTQELPAQTSLIDQICTPELMPTSKSLQQLCMNLALADACAFLLQVLPNVTNHGLEDVAGLPLPNGSTLTFKTTPFCGGSIGGIFTYTVTLTFPGGATSTCNANYFEPPKSSGGTVPCGPNDAIVRKSFQAARDVIIDCLKGGSSTSCYESFGCSC